MERVKRIVKHRTLRFAVVGVLNTVINFTILNVVFYAFGLNRYVASIIATVIAVLISFILNRNFVFAHKEGRQVRQLVMFITVTLFGIVVSQTVYVASNLLLQGNEAWAVNLIDSLTGIELPASFVSINLSNLFGTITAMVWNYNGYRLFVFKNKTETIKALDGENAR